MFLFIIFTFFYLKTESGSRLFQILSLKIYFRDSHFFLILIYIAWINFQLNTKLLKDFILKIFVILNPTTILIFHFLINQDAVSFDYTFWVGLILLILNFFNFQLLKKKKLSFIPTLLIIVISVILLILSQVRLLKYIERWFFMAEYCFYLYSLFYDELNKLFIKLKDKVHPFIKGYIP